MSLAEKIAQGTYKQALQTRENPSVISAKKRPMTSSAAGKMDRGGSPKNAVLEQMKQRASAVDTQYAPVKTNKKKQ